MGFTRSGVFRPCYLIGWHHTDGRFRAGVRSGRTFWSQDLETPRNLKTPRNLEIAYTPLLCGDLNLGSSPSFREYKCILLWLVMVTAMILRSYDGKEAGKILITVFQTVQMKQNILLVVFKNLFHGLYMFVSKWYGIISLVHFRVGYRLLIILWPNVISCVLQVYISLSLHD